MKFPILTILLACASIVCAQKSEYTIAAIPENLKANANAVVRVNREEVNITSRNMMVTKTYRVVSILNELGLKSINAQEYSKVKQIDAMIYDAFGNEIKKLRRKDFKEVSVSNGSMVTDNKMIYLDYTPTQYPFTVVYQSEVEDQNTAFIKPWYPLDEPLVGVEKSVVTVTYPSSLGFKYKESNFGNHPIKKHEQANSISFTAENLPAFRHESYSPAFSKLVPHVMFGLEKFHLEGVDGDATDWGKFSAWIYNNLLVGTDEISPQTQAKVKALVGNETDPIKKAKLVYQYVQDKTRYVSIQLGIGGWKPMLAKDVDRLGYGDCKALTNYTRALLKAVDVPSYYSVVYGDKNKRDLNADFVSMQGNHVILAIPNNDKLTWLECTSQTAPFGYEGRFTDDRMALLIKPEGGMLARTNAYLGKDSKQLSKGNYVIDETGSVSGAVEIRSTGIQYDNRDMLDRKSAEELTTFYKDYFNNLGNLKLKKTNISNDKEKVELVENVSLDAAGYANVSNNRMIFAVNVFNQSTDVPQRYRTRNNPVEISRGFYDYDEITIDLPKGYSIEAQPDDVKVKDKFGEYQLEIQQITPEQLVYKRTLHINEGHYENSEYENYRKFKEQIARADNSKMVLIKN